MSCSVEDELILNSCMEHIRLPGQLQETSHVTCLWSLIHQQRFKGIKAQGLSFMVWKLRAELLLYMSSCSDLLFMIPITSAQPLKARHTKNKSSWKCDSGVLNVKQLWLLFKTWRLSWHFNSNKENSTVFLPPEKERISFFMCVINCDMKQFWAFCRRTGPFRSSEGTSQSATSFGWTVSVWNYIMGPGSCYCVCDIIRWKCEKDTEAQCFKLHSAQEKLSTLTGQNHSGDPLFSSKQLIGVEVKEV